MIVEAAYSGGQHNLSGQPYGPCGDPAKLTTRAGYSPDRSFGVVLVRHTPGTTAVSAHESIVIVVHVVSARPILAFPAGRVVIIVAGVVGHAMLAVAGSIAMNGDCGPAVAAVAVAAGIAVITSAEAGAGVGRRRGADRGRRRRARVQREEVLLQPHAHRAARVRVVTRRQIENVDALFSLPDVQPKVLGGAVLLRLVPADGRIH